METLPDATKESFMEAGSWVRSKTGCPLSAIPLDQAREQENAIVHGSEGVIGLAKFPVVQYTFL